MFYVFEGPDGVGKTSALKQVEAQLKEKYPEKNIIYTREPGGSPNAEFLRKVVLSGEYDWDDFSTIFLFNAARADHLLKTILPGQLNGDIILCDRYWYSTLIFQAICGNPSLQPIVIQMQRWLSSRLTSRTDHSSFADPDRVFLLYADLETCLSRSGSRAEKAADRFDQNGVATPFQINVHREYGHLTDWVPKDLGKDVIYKIDASGELSDTVSQIMEMIDKDLG